MDWLALILALMGIGVAVYIPLRVEYERRPRLRIECGDDAEQRPPGMPAWRIVHVRVINDPITGRLAKWLLRNSATGCRVKLWFLSLRDGSNETLGPIPGSWSATPEPVQFMPRGGAILPLWDPQKQPGRFAYDVSPGSDGEIVAVAMKHEGDDEAYAFGPELYHGLPGPMKSPALKLPATEYEVLVQAEAGEIICERTFTLRNEGSSDAGLSLA